MITVDQCNVIFLSSGVLQSVSCYVFFLFVAVGTVKLREISSLFSFSCNHFIVLAPTPFSPLTIHVLPSGKALADQPSARRHFRFSFFQSSAELDMEAKPEKLSSNFCL